MSAFYLTQNVGKISLAEATLIEEPNEQFQFIIDEPGKYTLQAFLFCATFFHRILITIKPASSTFSASKYTLCAYFLRKN